MTQIWYSLRLSEDDYQLVIRTLQELILASSLEELTNGAMKINRGHLRRIVEVWRTWLQLSFREEDWITKVQERCLITDFEDPVGISLYLQNIPKEHKESASDWFTNRILSPEESRDVLPRGNFTLTGSDYVNSRNKGAFGYILESFTHTNPFRGWDYKDVKQWGNSASILKMYSEYVSHVLVKCALKLATGRVKFHFLLCNCMEIVPFLPPGRKYDRVITSNIADYVPITSILDTFKLLLNPSNPSSVITTEFINWMQFTNLRTEAIQRAQLLTLSHDDTFRRKVLEDTKNPNIAYSTGYQAFVDYHDHSTEFVQFLRAALLVPEIPDERKRKRKWNTVADYNGLIARDFLRCQNRVFPAKWTLNCRKVTMLHGFERAVEWIVEPRLSNTKLSAPNAAELISCRRALVDFVIISFLFLLLAFVVRYFW